MISEIRLENFQSIKSAVLKLGKVSAIVGNTDVGKSAVVRALFALARNRSSDSLLHKKCSPLRIEVLTDDGQTVALIRPRGQSAFYEFNGVKYKKTSREVPEDIEKVLGFKLYQVDKDVTVFPSIQRQLDPQFLIQQQDSVISKTIGHISNVSVVFAALRKAAADLQTAQNTVSTLSAQLLGLDNDLAQTKDVPFAVNIIAALSLRHKEVLALQEKAKSATHLAASMTEADLVQAEKLAKVQTLEKLVEVSSEAQLLLKKSSDLLRAKSGLEKVSAGLPVREESVTFLENARARVSTVKALFEAVRARLVCLHNLEQTRASHNRILTSARENTAALEKSATALAEIRKDLKVCPLTKTPFREGCVSEIVEVSRVTAR